MQRAHSVVDNVHNVLPDVTVGNIMLDIVQFYYSFTQACFCDTDLSLLQHGHQLSLMPIMNNAQCVHGQFFEPEPVKSIVIVKDHI